MIYFLQIMVTQTTQTISAADAAAADQTVRSGVERLLRIYSRQSQGPAVNAAARRMMCQLLDTRPARPALVRDDRGALKVSSDAIAPDDRELREPPTMQG